MSTLPGSPKVIPRSEHTISRRNIDADVLKVLYRLNHNGYQAFLVGGGVRDLLLGKQPKDFDIGTDARTETVRKLFRNSRTIGRRFRLNQVFFHGGKIFEVSTFRREGEESVEAAEEVAQIKSDNEYGDPQTDALRRDLTINGLFYDARSYAVIDYVGGWEDLQAGIIRFIGEPVTRVKEDPVRMIRATRHAARTGFQIEPVTWRAICDNAQLINESAPARVREEFLRELRGGAARASFRLLLEAGLLEHLAFPLVELYRARGEEMWRGLERVLDQIDVRVRGGEELSQAIIFSALFIDRIPEDAIPAGADNVVGELWQLNPVFREEDVLGRLIGEGVLRNFVSEFFKPLGLSRKEAEVLEKMIIGRYAMTQAYLKFESRRNSSGQEFQPPRLQDRSYFRPALELLELLADDELMRRVLEFWSARAGDSRFSGEREPGERPRRRRRRRGGRGRGRDRGGQSTASKPDIEGNY